MLSGGRRNFEKEGGAGQKGGANSGGWGKLTWSTLQRFSTLTLKSYLLI